MSNKIPHYTAWSLIALLYAPVFWLLYKVRWEFIDYTHAYFILPVALFLVWTRKEALVKTARPEPNHKAASLQGLLLLVLGLLMFTFGWKRDYQFIATLSIIPLLFGTVIYLYGTRTAKAVSFPIFYLLLLVPPPVGILDSITLPMRYGVSTTTEHILRAFHYPISREGLLLSIGGQQVYLGEACSGFRSLITLASLGLAYIYISKNNLMTKCVMAASIVPLALIGNLVRVTAVVLVTYYLGETRGQKFFHDSSGLAMFLILILGLIGVEKLLEKK